MSTLSRGVDKGSASKNGNAFGDVVLHPSLQKRIEQLACATANTKSHQAPFRNMLFYRPPGTGKTMAARKLARKSGLDYALMTGGDVAPLGPQAVTKIHWLFDCAKKSWKGLLLFIDEADAFLCERNKTYMGEAQRSELNALLFRTGDQSKDIVLALATNLPDDLDSAVADCIDEALEFPLPGEQERYKLLKLYLDKYIAQAGPKKSGWFKSLFKMEQQKIEIKGFTIIKLQSINRERNWQLIKLGCKRVKSSMKEFRLSLSNLLQAQANCQTLDTRGYMLKMIHKSRHTRDVESEYASKETMLYLNPVQE
ncbi:hypothetical protein CMV_016154 [Castanea mollissima]|uniref:AAA+ ATPase domain-containing protein n=1 Tax=Castanea mollissima TaxID=60419 RepID=A0A8J4VFF4_9ROSI|nr:hypothetical protein CMV_016154 [Castanea mollissima]